MAKWKTKDGRILDVVDMATSHVQNSVAMLRSNGYITPAEAKAILCEGVVGGKKSVTTVVGEIKKLHRVSSVLAEMEKELVRRANERPML